MTDAVRREVRVRCSVEHAFEVFTRRVDLWWPRDHRRRSAADMRFEPFAGGRFYQVGAGGEEIELGTVVRWDVAERLTYTWIPGSLTAPTTVDVFFKADGDHTRVAVVHSEGAADLGDAWPSRIARFKQGWADVLPAFEAFLTSGTHTLEKDQ